MLVRIFALVFTFASKKNKSPKLRFVFALCCPAVFDHNWEALYVGHSFILSFYGSVGEIGPKNLKVEKKTDACTFYRQKNNLN